MRPGGPGRQREGGATQPTSVCTAWGAGNALQGQGLWFGLIALESHHGAFAWTATAEFILGKVARIAQAINGASHQAGPIISTRSDTPILDC
jgi:hypothetical protein